MKKDNLGDRMKENYENRAKTQLLRRTPVIIRLDGKAFHTFTRGFKKPFDDILTEAMQQTMLTLCKEIQGCVLGYTQSDEITLILTDYKKLETAAWFDYDIQKVCSVSASIATLAFNKCFLKEMMQNKVGLANSVHFQAWTKGALFDSRCFNIPKEEVANCILWRQQDAIRNSINSVGQANFSYKELQGLSTDQILKKLLEEKQIDWNKLPVHLQRGSCCIKREVNGVDSWFIDTEIPIFKGEDRDYIEKLI
ncbi:tRNA(His) guanylyltransferase Thg1 family protein [Catenibacterium sp.]|uniref:tRNA(His) guanylyltransferase Thg1 family protein n=1 Tax=Catenibacterium sp. TaxID=2049022 RepID=UPI002E79AE00|nr:tRNA(His) guanylyltransferase Thg1 family protein [Catenibacterium sp.]MEE0040883.1 tRNA(His) guanylyltransferase Thg1 family protein [Catenibacterium sp.]